MKSNQTVLLLIVISQFCCTSMWFASNAVLTDLILEFGLEVSTLGMLTNFVQFGFICGTLVLSILSISDRFSPSKVFFISSLLGALFNIGIILESNALHMLLCFRFGVGFCLAGIYPVGMKIASDYFKEGLGKSLSYLVAALVLGTGFPHLLKALSSSFTLDWQMVIYSTSLIAVLGGLLVFSQIPDGPFRKAAPNIDFSQSLRIFKNKKFRSYTFGYVGHMWELYAFWAFVPALIASSFSTMSTVHISIWSFIIISIGSLACIFGGNISVLYGNQKTAITALIISGLCCLMFPLVSSWNESITLFLLLLWGMAVIADSPLLSALVAQNAPREFRGTALTIATCLGFTITIISIQLLSYLSSNYDTNYVYWILLAGPIFGVISVLRYEE